MKVHYAALLTFVVLTGCSGAEEPSDAFDDVESTAVLEQALNDSCGGATPDLTYNSNYDQSFIKGGFGAFNFKNNYDTCGKGYFVQVSAWKPYPLVAVGTGFRPQVTRLNGDFSGVSKTECPNVRSRMYVWTKNSNGSFSFLTSFTQKGVWDSSGNFCADSWDKAAMIALEDTLTQNYSGKTIKFGITARRGDGTSIVPVRVGARQVETR